MLVADYLETSLLDWEGKVSCILFLSGCNFRCPWCQNKDLALGKTDPDKAETIREILQKFKGKKNWIDGFVLTGGEPTINKTLKESIAEIKNNGFLVKIDTNGSHPDVIKDCISGGLVDSVAMDIKTSLNKEKYNIACGTDVNLDDINRTIDILLNSSVDCSFRTTAVPGIADIEDVKNILKRINPVRSGTSCYDTSNRVKGKKYTIQNFIPHNTLDDKYMKVKPYSEEEIKKIQAVLGSKF